MFLHHPINSSRLVVLLQQWAREDGERPRPSPSQPVNTDVAEQMAQWLSTVDAVKLSRALHAIETLPGEAGSLVSNQGVDLPALDHLFEKTRADLNALVTAKVLAPKPARARADNTPVQAPDPQVEAHYAAHGQRYLDLQKQMDTRLLALRVQVRHALAQGCLGLRQLAVLDAVMEQMLGPREQRLWASLAAHLERRLAHRHHKHLEVLENSGVADEPLRWAQPGGWLWAFEQDLQALLIAELQVRLLPISGLLDAAHNEKTG
ncbi:MAG: DUF3348 family protein [Acidovorax sp.]|uniref:DUF3348 family protein n=1 Tax=Acidovorax sp. TaxID=1872122 RepID=UPI00391A03C1